jgi:hypothetical protein
VSAAEVSAAEEGLRGLAIQAIEHLPVSAAEEVGERAPLQLPAPDHAIPEPAIEALEVSALPNGRGLLARARLRFAVPVSALQSL